MNILFKKKNTHGFTLIEVVLVLAIGGLIFLLAFLAYGQVSLNRRDTQRRNDLRSFVAELNNFKVDNNNKLPIRQTAPCLSPTAIPTKKDAATFSSTSPSLQSFINNYYRLSNSGDPSSGTYMIYTCGGIPPIGTITYVSDYSKCKNGELDYSTSYSTMDAVAIMKLEKGSICISVN